MAAKKEHIDVSRRNFLTGFRRLREKDPEAAHAPVAKTDETFEVLREANLAFRDERWEEAAERYREFLKSESKNPDARFRLGRCLYRLGKYMQAKVEFEQTLRLRREDQDAVLHLGLTLMRLDRADKGAVIWRMYRNPEAMPVQREVSIQLAFIEDESMEAPPAAVMADQVEEAMERHRRQSMNA
ncbi:MAG: tetratricopeptide repeat protein [Desulfovibrionaceae bacterium]